VWPVVVLVAAIGLVSGATGAAAAGPPARILFTRGEDPPNLFVVPAFGGNARLFLRNAGAAAVSPTGEEIAFIRHGEIWLMRRDGTEQTEVTRRPRGLYDVTGSLAWSPDGGTIYFSRLLSEDPNGESFGVEIFSLTVSDGIVRRLTRTGCDVTPSASSTGDMVYTWLDADCGHGLGGKIEEVTAGGIPLALPFRFPASDDVFDAVWSPDGRQLAYGGSEAGDLGMSPYGDLYVSSSDGSAPNRLIRVRHFSGIYTPAWSKDGTQLAFQLYGNNGEIWVIDANGANPHRLTRHANDSAPVWLQ
jgi:Tol biopolymer transport system component